MKKKKLKFIVIPTKVLRSQKLTANAKLLFGDILILCNGKGHCWASNAYFAELYKTSVSTISVWISSLQKNGFIKCKIGQDNKRQIFLKTSLDFLTTPSLEKSKDIYKGQESLQPPADDFLIETIKEWTDDKGRKHAIDSIDYDE